MAPSINAGQAAIRKQPMASAFFRSSSARMIDPWT